MKKGREKKEDCIRRELVPPRGNRTVLTEEKRMNHKVLLHT